MICSAWYSKYNCLAEMIYCYCIYAVRLERSSVLSTYFYHTLRQALTGLGLSEPLEVTLLEQTFLSLNWTALGRVLLFLFWNRNSWNDQNNSSFSGLSWLQTCQNQLTVSLWRFYSHSGMSSPRTNNYLAYSNYSYSGIGTKKRTL